MQENLKILKTFTKRLGGSLKKITDDKFKNLRNKNLVGVAPFVKYNLGVDYDNKIIYYTDNSHWGHVIHEMAHVFASTKPPSTSDEASFIGWEFAVTKYLHLDIDDWCNQLSDYIIDDNLSFKELSTEQRYIFLNERYNFSLSEGMISGCGIPQSIR